MSTAQGQLHFEKSFGQCQVQATEVSQIAYEEVFY